MHKAAARRGWYRLAPLSLSLSLQTRTHTDSSSLTPQPYKTPRNPVILTYMTYTVKWHWQLVYSCIAARGGEQGVGRGDESDSEGRGERGRGGYRGYANRLKQLL